MDEKTKKLLMSLIEVSRDNSFDICFCLEILKQNKEVAKLYEKAKEMFEEQKKQNIEKEGE
jgi:hypothetical protein